MTAPRLPLSLALLLALAGCGGRQSVLAPAGQDAADVAGLFWVMLIGAAVLWLALVALFLYVTQINIARMSRRKGEALIIGGGIAFPVLVLAALLVYSLPMMSAQRGPGDRLTVRVTAEQWWWRVEYWPEGADAPITAANEIRLPADLRSEIVLNAHNVIHSFWIPSLGGKTDMIPGRETFMSLKPTIPGTYRGQCAEFCGASHALMAFEAVVLPEEAFDRWLEAEAEDAMPPATAQAEYGAEVFAREGCGACHTVRGTPAIGRVGPDLTHVGSRKSLAAGILPVTTDGFSDWIAHTGAIKPDVRMPTYDFLPAADLTALGHYLEGLK